MSALMEIIIKGIDQASSVGSKVSNVYQSAAEKITSANNRATQSTEKLSQAYQKVGSAGISAYAQLSAKEQEHYQKISQSQAKLESLASSGTKMGNAIATGMNVAGSVMTTIHHTATELKNTIASTTIGNHLLSGLETAHTKITSFKNKFDEIKSKASAVGSHIGTALGNGLTTAKNKIDAINNSLGVMGQAITTAVGAIGVGSIYQLTVGLGMAREQMTTLMTATTGSASAASKLVNQLDQITNNSVGGLSELGNAMNSIKISTGMTTDQLSLIAPTVDKVGQAAILMGKDTGMSQELMVASFRGLNGEFDMLKTNFGITKDTLINAGWSGAQTDVEGYNAALSKVLDENINLSTVMDSTTGRVEKIKKAFRTAGKTIGEQVVPYIDRVATAFLALTQQFPGLTTGIIVAAAGFMLFLTALPVLGYLMGSLKALAGFLGIVEAKEGALTLAIVRRNIVSALSTIWTYAQAAAFVVASVAAQLYVIATQNASIATKAFIIAQALLNTILSLNPILLVVIALVALIAILWYLYNTNESVRNAINWLWAGLQQLGGYIYGGLLAAWNALVGVLTWVWSGLVQVGSYIMGGLMAAWNSITSALAPIIVALGYLWAALSKVFGGWLNGKAGEANGLFQALAGAVGALWAAFSQLAGIIGSALAPYFNQLLVVLQVVWAFMSSAFAAVWRTVGGVIMAVINYIATFITILANLISGNITVGEALGQIWAAIQVLFAQVFQSILLGVGAFALKLVNYAMQAGAGMLQSFIAFLPQIPGKVAFFLGFVIGKIAAFNLTLMTTLASLGLQLLTWIVTTGINLMLALGTWLMQLPGFIWTWLLNTLMYVLSWGAAMVSYGANAAANFITAIIAWVSSLPGLLWGYLLSGLAYIMSFGGTAGSYASSAGSNIVNGLRNSITSLPDVVWNELMNVYHKLTSVGGMLYDAAVGLGTQIVNGLKAGAGIASPGDMYRAIVAEVEYIDDALTDNDLPDTSRKLGKDISEAFGPETDTAINSKTGKKGTDSETNKAELTLIVKHEFDFKNFSEISSVLTKDELISVLKSIVYNNEWLDVLVKSLTKAKSITKLNLGV